MLDNISTHDDARVLLAAASRVRSKNMCVCVFAPEMFILHGSVQMEMDPSLSPRRPSLSLFIDRANKDE